MAEQQDGVVGSVVSLWRYPVKSMLGEELNAAPVGANGVFGDRTYALRDRADGKIATAKNPRKWPRLFDCRARFLDDPRDDGPPPVRITLPDGSVVASTEADRDEALSRELGRAVTLTEASRDAVAPTDATPAKASVKAEAYSPDIDGVDHRDAVAD